MYNTYGEKSRQSPVIVIAGCSESRSVKYRKDEKRLHKTPCELRLERKNGEHTLRHFMYLAPACIAKKMRGEMVLPQSDFLLGKAWVQACGRHLHNCNFGKITLDACNYQHIVRPTLVETGASRCFFHFLLSGPLHPFCERFPHQRYLRVSIVIMTNDGPKSHVFPYVCAQYLVMITIFPRINNT